MDSKASADMKGTREQNTDVLSIGRIVLYTCISLFFCSTHVLAHQFQSDGSLTIMQHSDPDDNPIAGTTARLYLSFTHKEKLFVGSECDCTVFIAPYANLSHIETSGDRFSLNTNEARAVYGENYEIPYVFPKRGIYAIVVEGAPKEDGLFAPFRVVFDIRVEREVSLSNRSGITTMTQSPTMYLGLFFVTTLVLFFSISVGILTLRRFRHKK